MLTTKFGFSAWICDEGLVPNPLFLIVEKVIDSSNSDNLTHVFINSMMINGGFFQENIQYGTLCLLKPHYLLVKIQKTIHIQ